MAGTVTIYDVAKEAGASPATVSRVLNHPETVAEKTAAKIIAAMEKLNFPYEKQVEEKQRAAGGYIVVVLPSLGNPFYDEIVNAIRSGAEDRGLSVMVMPEPVSEGKASQWKALARSTSTAGFITFAKGDAAAMEKLAAKKPLVQCCEVTESRLIPSVTIDDYEAACRVMDHLIGLGRRRIAFLNGPISYEYAKKRLWGYRDTLLQRGMEFREEFIFNVAVDYNAGYSAAVRLFTRDLLPDAVFTSSDVFAVSAIRAATQAGLRVPEDVCITGFDNIDFSAVTVPSITTVNQPRERLGFTALELLLEKMADPGAAVRHLTLDTELVIRESTQIKKR